MSRLKKFNTQAGSLPASDGTQFNKLEALANGEYPCFIDSIALKELDTGDVLAVKLIVNITDSQAITVDWDTWLTGSDDYGNFSLKEPTVKYLRSQLKSLGVDEQAWEPDLFFDRLEQCLPFLKGMSFKGRKTSKPGEKDGKLFHNLYVKNRIQDGRPARITVDMLLGSPPTPVARPAAQAAAGQAANPNEDIPFGFLIALAASVISTLV